MRLVFAIAVFLGSTMSIHADDIERDKWVEQVGNATQSCVVLFSQKFGDAKTTKGPKGKDFADCLTDQTEEAIKPCIGTSRSEFPKCVASRSLHVMEACDLTRC